MVTKKRKKPTKRSTLKNRADKLAGDFVRARGYCEASGKDDIRCGGPLQWAHLEGRRNLRLRWEPWGALCLCAGHHRAYTDRPIAWVAFLEEHFPGYLEKVREHKHEYFDGDYDALLARLRAEYVS